MNHQYTINQLPNGLRVLHVPYPNAPDVFLTITGKGGFRSEQSDEAGAAHFLEHLFLDGTKKRPSTVELNTFIENEGGSRQGLTGPERVEYSARILRENADVAFEFLSDIFMNSLLNEKDVEKERKVITQETARQRDNPTALLDRLSRSTLYPDQAVGRTLLDAEPNLAAISQELLTTYRDRLYNASNFILTIAGGIELEPAMQLANKYFGSLKQGDVVQFEPATINKSSETSVNHADLKQTNISISFEGYPITAPEIVTADLLNVILGRSSSSRLSVRIRQELHLAYSINSSVVELSDTGYFSIRSAVAEDNVKQTITEIQKVIETLIKDGITKEELRRAKNKSLASLFISMENIPSRARFLTNQLLWKDKIEDVEERAERVRQTTIDEVNQVARKIFSDQPKIVILTKNPAKIQVP